MPSGAKRRKAAKKKKQVQPIQPPSRSHGEENLKRDDKESDSEGSSPASQDHQNQFTEGEVENGEGKEVEIVGTKDGDLVQVERELKVEGESESQKINVEVVEPVVESYKAELRRSSSSSSSSSNSSVEKHDVADKNNIVVDEASAVELVKDIESLLDKNSYVVDDAPDVELVKDNEYLPDKNIIVVDDAPAVELVKDNETLRDKNSIVVDDAPAVELVKDIKNSVVVDDAPAVELVKDIESLPEKNSVVVDDAPAVELVKENESLPDTQVADSLVGTTSTSDLNKAAISEDIVQVTTSASDADNMTTTTVDLVVKERGEENLSVVDEKDTASHTAVENWEENLGAIVDKATISEVLVETGSEERDEAASAASCDATAILNENVKESPAPECHDHQLTALPSRPVQTTSWKGCCGLFELFAGSNR